MQAVVSEADLQKAASPKSETKDVVPKGKTVTSSSSSQDIQLHTVVPRVDIQKVASPKPETKDVVPKIKEVSSSPDIQFQLQAGVSEADIQKTASPKPETKDVVPKRKEVPSPSSSSLDIQLQTVVPRVDIQKTASPKPVTQPIQSITRPVTVRKLFGKPEKKVWKPVSARFSSSGQPSSSGDIQLQIVVPRAHLQKTASPKPAAQPVQSMSRPVTMSVPITPRKQAALVVSAVQTSTLSFSHSMRSTFRIGSPPHNQTYIPQSYQHAIVSSSGIGNSSSQPTVTSPLRPYSHPPPLVSVSNQSALPINFGSLDEVLSSGLLWTCGSGSNKDTTTTTTTTAISGNHGTNPCNTRIINDQFGRRAQAQSLDEYPHLGLINDLLEE
ncbi:unnamed protein product [Microthlaspi erraticum]|uniref:Uncharacterized protein n=1 Tax=Microthlaspi erraticum TaxID=1685480 RepID=A0A6D2KYY7_9BRAS|nr:unnamed protein product [Microthlaspi erraticum]